MTEKEKANAYDDALKKASAAYKDEDRHLKATLERIFPELKESEDEKIKKAILNHLKKMWENCENDVCGVHVGDAINWLEKQGKNSIDKTKPRFNIGDWVVYITNKSIYQVEKKENCQYILRHHILGDLILYLPFSLEGLIREWTIQDAKDGDVLYCKSGWMCIFKAINNHTNTFSSYCFMSSNKCFFSSGSESHTLDKKFIKAYNVEIYPATKEQRDTFMKAMNDAGYEWDTENKELKKYKR